jgi:hypothetical protein
MNGLNEISIVKGLDSFFGANFGGQNLRAHRKDAKSAKKNIAPRRAQR